MRTGIYAGGNVSRVIACARSVLRASSVSLFFAFRGCASDAKEASLTSKVDPAFFISFQQGELPGSGVLGCILCLCEETLPLFQEARVCCCSSSSCRSSPCSQEVTLETTCLAVTLAQEVFIGIHV
ncbi:unnamed protein product [Polarella glacialis]|uniref:Uncharacterized protein n=1 Tax=Polarella glacialis TaxID=89957 RepID=A0A813LEU1_POLGL|nr:unnamed protein product [Polarella glacialis]